MIEIEANQIWREVGPRFERFVRVEQVANGNRRGILVRTVVRSNGDGPWIRAPRSRASWRDRNRFNGRRGGYQYVETQQ